MAANTQPFTTLTILSLLTLNSSNISFNSTPFLFSKSQPSVSQWLGHFQGKFQRVFALESEVSNALHKEQKLKLGKWFHLSQSAHCFQVQVLWVKFFGYICIFFFFFLPFCICETFSPSLLCFWSFFLMIFYFF